METFESLKKENQCLRDRVGKLREALNGWIESYSLMSEKTDGLLRDSIRGFFLNCPYNTKKAFSEDDKSEVKKNDTL